jgi:hypothetical protein
MVLCHICGDMALQDPRSYGHLLRDPVSNNGAPCEGCPLHFCYRHLYLNWDGAMCQRSKYLFMNDDPDHTTHALVAHWVSWGPLQGYAGMSPPSLCLLTSVALILNS